MRERSIPFREVPTRFVGDPATNPAYEQKYAELNSVAYVLAAAGRSDIDFYPRESPDFELRVNGSVLGFAEVVRVVDPGKARYDGLLDQVNVALRLRSEADASFAASIAQVFCEVVLPEPPLKRDRSKFIGELVEFLATESLNVDAPEILPIGDEFLLLHAAKASAIAVKPNGAGHLAFRRPPRCTGHFDLSMIEKSLAQKRKSAVQYHGSPIWLIMYSDDASVPSLPTFPNALERLQGVDLDIAPFDRVFIGGQRQVLELSASDIGGRTA